MGSFLCLDQGGHSSRALVVDREGGIVATAHCAVATSRPGLDRVEQDPQAVVGSLRSVAQAALAQLTASQRRHIKAAGLVTQRASLVCWRRSSGAALTPIISWQDTRAAAWLAQHYPPLALSSLSGLRPNAHLGASKYRWCLDELPEVATAAAADDLVMGPLASFLAHQLGRSARFRIDPANAARTLLWDLRRGDWSQPLLDFFGLRRDFFPEAGATLDDYGELTCDGLSLPLRLLNGDQSAAVFAYGRPALHSAALNLGTGAFVSTPLAAPGVEAAPLLVGCVLDGPKPLFILEGTVHGAAAALDWFAERAGVVNYTEQLEAALTSAHEPLLFINGVGGIGSPDWRTRVESGFVQTGPVSVDRLAELAGVVESIVFLLQRNLEVMQSQGSITRLTVSGGLARSDALCQRIADLCKLPLRRFQDQEASALGAAFLLAGEPDRWRPALNWRDFAPQDNSPLRRRYVQWSAALNERLANSSD